MTSSNRNDCETLNNSFDHSNCSNLEDSIPSSGNCPDLSSPIGVSPEPVPLPLPTPTPTPDPTPTPTPTPDPTPTPEPSPIPSPDNPDPPHPPEPPYHPPVPVDPPPYPGDPRPGYIWRLDVIYNKVFYYNQLYYCGRCCTWSHMGPVICREGEAGEPSIEAYPQQHFYYTPFIRDNNNGNLITFQTGLNIVTRTGSNWRGCAASPSRSYSDSFFNFEATYTQHRNGQTYLREVRYGSWRNVVSRGNVNQGRPGYGDSGCGTYGTSYMVPVVDFEWEEILWD